MSNDHLDIHTSPHVTIGGYLTKKEYKTKTSSLATLQHIFTSEISNSRQPSVEIVFLK